MTIQGAKKVRYLMV